MAGMGGFRAGSVYIDVYADTSRFRRQVLEATHGVDDIKIKLDPEDSELSRSFHRWDGRTGHIDFEFDTDGADEFRKQTQAASDVFRKLNEETGQHVSDWKQVVNNSKYYERSVKRASTQVESLTKSIAKVEAVRDKAAKNGQKDIVNAANDNLKQLNYQLAKTKTNLQRLTKTSESYKKSLDGISKGSIGEFDNTQRKLDQLAGVMKTLQRQGIKIGEDVGKGLTGAQKSLENYRRLLATDPINLKAKFDSGDYDRDVTAFIAKAKADAARLTRELSVKARVDFQQQGIDKMRAELDKLEHKRLNIPADIKLDYENVIAERERLIRQIKANPNVDWELEMNVDVDEQKARRKLKDLRNDYDKIDMDVDLETAAARAHLAYFTRPRTVDIFARFRGTDMGKIMQGMTVGATGLKTVENQFSKLVDLFDTLDRKVPVLATVGTVLSDIGAGAINLAGTVGGLGKSIVSMSKAAYAAPAALAGMGVAYASLRMIIGEEGAAWKENINLTGTALDGLGSKVQDAFYGKAAPAFKQFADMVGNVVGPQMSLLAEREADVFTGMLKMTEQSSKVGQLGRVFTHVNDSIAMLTPGVKSVTRAFLDLSDVGGTYLAQFSNWVSRNMTWFAQWAHSVAADSSRVDRAMAQVKEQAGYLGSSLFSLKGIVKGVFEPLAHNQNGLERFAANLAKAERAVNSISFQDTMNAWVTGAQNAQHGMRNAFNQIGDAANVMRQDFSATMGNLGELTGNVFGDIASLASKASPSISRFSEGVRDGFSSISSAVSEASPAISALIGMAGQLTRTFGGTFAATLKAAAPTIEAIANATNTVAQAFDRLPDSIKGALGLWATFGKAGVSAFNSLKMGMLENITGMLSYRKTLASVGLSADSAGISFGKLVQAQLSLRNGNIAGALTETGTAASKAASGVGTLAVGMGNTSSKVGGLAGKVGGLTGVLGKVAGGAKTVGKALLGAVGGPAVLGVTAGLTVLGQAWTAYQQHLSDTKARQENLNTALRATPGALTGTIESLDEVKTHLTNLDKATADNISNRKYSFLDTALGKYTTGDATESMKTLGVSVNDVAKAAMGSTEQYNKFIDSLNSAREPFKTNVKFGEDMSANLNLTNIEAAKNSQTYAKLSAAAQNIINDMAENRKQVQANLEATAALRGENSNYVQSLLDEGQTLPGIAEGLLDNSEKSERLASVKSTLASAVKQESSAWIQNQAAGSAYYKTLEQIKPTLEQVHAAVESGQPVWDSQAKSFNLTTEMGRAASDAITSLASNASAYVDAMIASGQTTDSVMPKYNELRGNLEDVARQAGVSGDQIGELVDQLLGTPSEVKTKIEVQSLEAKSQLASVIDSMQYLFPDDSREQTRQILLNSVWSGKMDAQGLSNIVTDLTDGDKTVIINSNADQAVTVTNELKTKLDELGSTACDVFIQAKTEGKSDVDALNDVVNALRGTNEQVLLNGTTTGQELLDRMKNTIEQTPVNPSATMHGSTTGQDQLDRMKNTVDSTPANSNKVMHGSTTGQGQLDHMKQTISSTNNKNVRLTAKGVDNGLSGIANQWHGLQSKTITLTTRTIVERISSGEHVPFNQLGAGKATGGIIIGPGTGTSDDILIRASNGEFMMRQKAVAKLDRTVGRNFLNVLNRTGDVDLALANANNRYLASAVNMARGAYATGGRVSEYFGSSGTVDNRTTVNNTTINSPVKIVRSDQDLQSAGQIYRSGLFRQVGRLGSNA